MPISKTAELFTLIKSLTKAEKRNFRFYAARIQDAENLKYLKLFDLLEKQQKVNEKILETAFKKPQLSNLKRHLYGQILTSIRQLQIKKQNTIKVREYIDFANILYGKGLYKQSLKILAKSKSLAKKVDDNMLVLAIVEFQKTIESRHITRSGVDESFVLIDEAKVLSTDISNEVLLSNLRLKLQSHYITKGQAINQLQAETFKAEFEHQFEKINTNSLNDLQQVYFYQAKVRYHHNLVEFKDCLKFAKLWVNKSLEKPELVHSDVNLLLIGYHYILLSAFYLEKPEVFEQYLPAFIDFRKSNYPKFNYNSQILSFVYVHQAILNKHILLGDFKLGIDVYLRTDKRLIKYTKNLDVHRKMVFYYKAAWINLGAKNYSNCVKYLNDIIYLEVGALREDIQSYSRLMRLMANYDDKSFETIQYLKKETNNYFSKLSETSKLQKTTLNFFNEIVKLPLLEHSSLLQSFKTELEIINKDVFERSAFLYLDVLSWVKSKVENKTLAKIVKEKLS